MHRSLTGWKIAWPGSFADSPLNLLGRLYLLAGILALECLLLAVIPRTVPFLGPVASFGIVSFAMFLVLGHSTLKAQQADTSFHAGFFTAHLSCMAMLYLGCLIEQHGIAFLSGQMALFVLRVLLLLAILLLFLAAASFRVWKHAIRATGWLWLYSCMAGAAAWGLRTPFQSLWTPSAHGHGSFLQMASFYATYAVLRPLIPGISMNASSWVMGTPGFSVRITEECSGMEGIGLVLVFSIVWLLYCRKEVRFPRVFLLVPGALLSVWMLNIVRLCCILLIGNAGAPDIAMVGFHSQAGWIAFTLVAVLFTLAAQKISWVRKASEGTVSGSIAHDVIAERAGTESPATTAYLTPFLAILAASFISRAASGYFEWLYPLRFVAAAAVLWHCRQEYKKLDWRFSWLAPVVGAAVFLVWIASSWWAGKPANSMLGPALSALPPAARFTWIAFRVVAAVVTVPIAEELAFRGYLMRRVMGREFDCVAFSQWTLLSVTVSSVAFGLMHGQHWFVGILAGLAYAAVLCRRGRFGDAVVAHATSNLLLAAWVLLCGDWALW